jgi:hypothetical protein
MSRRITVLHGINCPDWHPSTLRPFQPNRSVGSTDPYFCLLPLDFLVSANARNGGVTMQSFIPRFFKVCQFVTCGDTG